MALKVKIIKQKDEKFIAMSRKW